MIYLISQTQKWFPAAPVRPLLATTKGGRWKRERGWSLQGGLGECCFLSVHLLLPPRPGWRGCLWSRWS